MAFQRILRGLLSRTHGSLGAIFLDSEGETVEAVTERPFDADDHDLRVIGAYQGIFLTRLRELAALMPVGTPTRFKVEFEKMSTLSCDIKDGYYLVLILDLDANEGIAWQRLLATREELLIEM